jgi:hypothetical protein
MTTVRESNSTDAIVDDSRFDRYRDNSGNWVAPSGTWKFAAPFGLLSGVVAWLVGARDARTIGAIGVFGYLFGSALAEYAQGGPVRMIQPGAIIGPNRPLLRAIYVLALGGMYLAVYRFAWH